MSGSRIKLLDIATKIATSMSVTVADEAASCYVSTSFDPKYLRLFAKKFPAVWVVAQRLRPRDDGRGLTTLQRQHVFVEILVRPVIQRYINTGADDVEDRLQTLSDSVNTAILAWKPTGAAQPLAWRSQVDGPSAESFCVLDMIYVTEVVYSKPVT